MSLAPWEALRRAWPKKRAEHNTEEAPGEERQAPRPRPKEAPKASYVYLHTERGPKFEPTSVCDCGQLLDDQAWFVHVELNPTHFQRPVPRGEG